MENEEQKRSQRHINTALCFSEVKDSYKTINGRRETECEEQECCDSPRFVSSANLVGEVAHGLLITPVSVSVSCGFDLSKPSWWAEALVVVQVGEHGGVAAGRARGKERVVRGQDEVAAAADLDERSRSGGLQVLVVAGKKLEAQQVVAGDKALDLVENCERIERAEFRVEGVRGKADSMGIN